MKTIFEKIIARELEAEIVAETKDIIVIKDKYPKAPVHLLIIPKKKIIDLQSMQSEDLYLMHEIVTLAQKVAKDFGIDKSGYRFLVNNGRDGGQEIFHLHFHLIGGSKLGQMV